MLGPGDSIDRYVVERKLGQGAMAEVFLARHVQLRTPVAIKILLQTSPPVVKRLLQEGKVQATLRHPNIVAVTEVLEVNGHPGLVLEYVDGPTLQELLAEGPLPLDVADSLAQGIIAGVAEAHRWGLIHRDLKPANILIATESGRKVPKIADFGLAKFLDRRQGQSLTRVGVGMGTPAYMAPEQALNAKHADRRADIFSLGAILYELVCGRRAFPGDKLGQVLALAAGGEYIHPECACPGLPRGRCEAIHGALVPEQEGRIPDCEILLAVWKGVRSWRVGPAPARAPRPRDIPRPAGAVAVETWSPEPDVGRGSPAGSPPDTAVSARPSGAGAPLVPAVTAPWPVARGPAPPAPGISEPPEVPERSWDLQPGPAADRRVTGVGHAGWSEGRGERRETLSPVGTDFAGGDSRTAASLGACVETVQLDEAAWERAVQPTPPRAPRSVGPVILAFGGCAAVLLAAFVALGATLALLFFLQ